MYNRKKKRKKKKTSHRMDTPIFGAERQAIGRWEDKHEVTFVPDMGMAIWDPEDEGQWSHRSRGGTHS